MASPAYESVHMWNILPSYQLYEATFSKKVTPDEDCDRDPPTYEVSSPGSADGQDYFTHPGAPRWENSILANVHRLKRLATFNADLAAQLKVQVQLTAEPGARGVAPQLFDGEKSELAQGDQVHGFVTVQNVSSQSLPFDMFSVVLEGKISMLGSEDKQAMVYKFLNMFDYRASWTPAFVDETITVECVDPVDGTRLSFPMEKYFEPGVTYKKFFTFTLPPKLLDCCCEDHNLSCHCELLPTIGLDKEMFLQRLRRAREKPSTAHSQPRLRDYGFSDTAISYCVEARVVGKLSDYGLPVDHEEFMIAGLASAPVRVIPHSFSMSEEEDRVAYNYYKTFVREIKDSIKRGQEMVNGTRKDDATRRSSVVKRNQLYHRNTGEAPDIGEHQIFLPYKRKTLTQPLKIVGMLSASTPRIRYSVPYVSPLQRVTPEQMASLKLNIPVMLSFKSSEEKGTVPEIRGVSAELVVTTVRSKKYPIPLELSLEMFFENKLGADSIQETVRTPFASFLTNISSLSEKIPLEQFDISAQTVKDIKCLAKLGIKTNNLKISGIQAVSAGGLLKWNQKNDKYSKRIDVAMDLGSLFKLDSRGDRGLELECLVPTFQSCFACRYYFIVMNIKLQSGESLPIKVALDIENRSHNIIV